MKKSVLLFSILSIGSVCSIGLLPTTGCSFGGGGEIDPVVRPTNILINYDSQILKIGQSKQLSATVEPAEADQKIIWASSNDQVATVDSTGMITGVGPGAVIITASPQDKSIPGKACNVRVYNTPPRLNFSTCSWIDLCVYCEELYSGQINEETFLSKFKVWNLETINPYDTKDVTSFDDFIGQSRKISVNAQENHEVFVIDCNRDVFLAEQDDENDETQVPAFFTFQFRTLVSDENGDALLTSSEAEVSSGQRKDKYWGSKLDIFLNGDPEAPQQPSILKSIEIDNNRWASNIKSVYRGVAEWTPSSPTSWASIYSYTKLFCPSVHAIYSHRAVPVTVEEPNQYAYYSKMIGSEQTTAASWFECLFLNDINGNDISYWLPSPSPEEDARYSIIPQKAYHGACLVHNIKVDQQLAIAPCFCL